MRVPGARSRIARPQLTDWDDSAVGAHKCVWNDAPALLDYLRRHVEDAYEGDRPGRHAAGGGDTIVLRAEMAERKAGPAAGLMNERLMLDPVEDGFQRILDGQHEAGGELLQVAARVHERGRVGQELQPAHHVVERLGHVRKVFLAVRVSAFGFGDVAGHPAEHPGGRFDRLAGGILHQIPAAEHGQRVGRKARRFLQTVRHRMFPLERENGII